MTNMHSNLKPLVIIFIVLCLVAAVNIWRKVAYLGYTFVPNQHETAWLIESKIEFDALEHTPITVQFSIPEIPNGYKIMQESIASAGYGFEKRINNMHQNAIWTRNSANGKQVIYYRFKVYDLETAMKIKAAAEPPTPPAPIWGESEEYAATQIMKYIKERTASTHDICQQLSNILNSKEISKEIAIIIKPYTDEEEKINIIQNLLAMEKIPSRQVWGLDLINDANRIKARRLLQIYDNGYWLIFDPHGETKTTGHTILLTNNEESLLSVMGGKNSQVSFSVMKEIINSNNLLSERAKVTDLHDTFRFSLYNLPLESQNAFHLLMIIPLGILIVVVIRNIIGISTLGTFMPILIGMAFLQTGITTGLFYFCIIIAIGLLIRGYLSKLNLLLVPRIGAVVVVVIIIMQALTVLSYQLGFQSATAITYFPIIILAWTIERVSIKWEEDGPHNALKETFASLVTGLLTYFVLSNNYIRHIMYSFNEFNIIILGLILLIGTYTGYRLSELHRFNPLVSRDENL